MEDNVEEQLVKLVAMDRIEIPISSMSGKLKRQKPKLASDINLNEYGGKFKGDRVYARVEFEDKLKARGMAEGIEEFTRQYPKYGELLAAIIEEKRSEGETHLYFGMNEGSRLSSEDYMGILMDLGFTETTARNLYPDLIEVSRKISKKRDEERRVLID